MYIAEPVNMMRWRTTLTWQLTKRKMGIAVLGK
jgi:hypothetical protein